MPAGRAIVVGFPVEDDDLGNVIEVVVTTTDALVTWHQQVFMQVDHVETEIAVHGDNKLGLCHIIM